jgi:hypothetical protein
MTADIPHRIIENSYKFHQLNEEDSNDGTSIHQKLSHNCDKQINHNQTGNNSYGTHTFVVRLNMLISNWNRIEQCVFRAMD